MVRRRPGETDSAYVGRLRAVMLAADPRPAEVLTPEEETRRAIRSALADVQRGAPYGYMNGARLEDYRRIEQLARDLNDARRLGFPDIDTRAAEAVATAGDVAAPWCGRWD